VHVLVVEDEPRISSFVKRGLEAEGFDVTVSDDGRRGLDLARSGAYDLVILDLILPGMPGEEVLERIQEEQPDVPVIVLTAKDSISDRVTNIEAGADDYLIKPFSFAELLARINARLRAARRPEPAVLSAAGILVDPRRATATVDDRTVDLTARELALLQAFVRRPGEVLSAASLLDRVWGTEREDPDVVHAYVRYLRRKLGVDVIESVPPAGYRLRAAGPQAPASSG
jgi:DNA-binding response OmpR family regulator